MTRVGTAPLLYQPTPDWLSLPPEVELVEAVGVAVDSADRLVIFNRGGKESVLIVNPDGTLADAWGEGLFNRPHGISLAPDETLYLVDDLGHGVHQFTLDGKRLRQIGPAGDPSDTGAEGFDYRPMRRGGPPYNLPTNAVTNDEGEIFVVDGYGNARVHRFTAAGELAASWGEPGDGPGQFRVPHGLAIDADQRLYVADRENSRIQVFSSTGELLGQWTDLVRPCQAYVAADGLVYVAELGRRAGLFPWMDFQTDAIGGRVSVWDQDGNLRCRWGGGTDSRVLDQFFTPHDICVDSRGNVFVGEVAKSAQPGDPAIDPAGLPTLRRFERVT